MMTLASSIEAEGLDYLGSLNTAYSVIAPLVTMDWTFYVVLGNYRYLNIHFIVVPHVYDVRVTVNNAEV